MKRIVFLFISIIVMYSIYFDLTRGTLPAYSTPVENMGETIEKEGTIPFKKVKIAAGDTLLSVMEREEGQVTTPIQTIIADFQKLNKSTSPHELQIGEIYKFPIYMKQ